MNFIQKNKWMIILMLLIVVIVYYVVLSPKIKKQNTLTTQLKCCIKTTKSK